MSKEMISIIVPCYNEEEALPIFYKEINRVSKEMISKVLDNVLVIVLNYIFSKLFIFKK